MKLIELFISKITEGVTDILYHYTRFHAAKSILETGEFKLSSSTTDDQHGLKSIKDLVEFLKNKWRNIQ